MYIDCQCLKKNAYGKKNFPWSLSKFSKKINYNKGIYPVAEDLLDNSYLGFLMCGFSLNNKDVDLIIKAFSKIWDNINDLKMHK